MNQTLTGAGALLFAGLAGPAHAQATTVSESNPGGMIAVLAESYHGLPDGVVFYARDGHRAFPKMIFSALAAVSGKPEIDMEPPTAPMRRLLEILFQDGEDEAAAYYASLDAPATVKQRAGAMHAAGPPDSEVGESATAWASATPNDHVEWLDLDYAEPVAAQRILVFQTQIPGAVTRIAKLDDNGAETELKVTNDREFTPSGVFVAEYVLPRSTLLSRIRLAVDAPSVLGWNQIDAVGLVDTGGIVKWASKASASSNEYETRSPDIFDTPSVWALHKVAETYFNFDRYDDAARILSLRARLFPDAPESDALRAPAARAGTN